jgi:DNA-binding transcriptional MerR regulator
MLVTSGDIAETAGVTADCVRRWESGGKLPKASRTLGGHRRWHVRDVAPVLMAEGYDVPAAWYAALGVAA